MGFKLRQDKPDVLHGVVENLQNLLTLSNAGKKLRLRKMQSCHRFTPTITQAQKRSRPLQHESVVCKSTSITFSLVNSLLNLAEKFILLVNGFCSVVLLIGGTILFNFYMLKQRHPQHCGKSNPQSCLASILYEVINSFNRWKGQNQPQTSKCNVFFSG